MTWAAFGTNGKTELKIIQGRLNSIGYQELLAEALLPCGAAIGGPDGIFQQDNAPIHVSRSSQQWIQNHEMRKN